MPAAFSSAYYISKKRKLLLRFDRVAKKAKKSLVKHHGHDFAQKILEQSRREYEALIPQLPYVGGPGNLISYVIIINGWIIAFYRAMKENGKSVEDVIRTACEVADSYFAPFPRPFLKLIGRLAFGRAFRMLLKQQAARSRKRKFSQDWVFEVIDGHCGDFDLALVMNECAVQKMYAVFDAMELAPYCNLFDITYSRYMGMGLDASKTMGLGHKTCTLRYKKDGKTEIPKILAPLMPEI